jgi:hypothetical protein
MLKVGSMIETDENGRFYRPVKISVLVHLQKLGPKLEDNDFVSQ